MNNFEPLKEVKKLELRPGSRFVLQFEEHLPASAHDRIQAAWAHFITGDQEGDVGEFRLLILSSGAQLSVVHPTEEKPD